MSQQLTPNQQKFLENKMSGMTNYAAYLDAYPSSRSWKRASVDVAAWKIMQNEKIKQRLEEYQRIKEKDLRDKTNRSFYKSIKDLQDVISLSKEQMAEEGVTQANTRAVIDAVKEINQMLGYTKDLEIREKKVNSEIKEDVKESKTIIVENLEEMKEWLKDEKD